MNTLCKYPDKELKYGQFPRSLPQAPSQSLLKLLTSQYVLFYDRLPLVIVSFMEVIHVVACGTVWIFLIIYPFYFCGHLICLHF